MLTAKETMATVAVRDLTAAKRFYQDVLGLKLTDTQEAEALTFQAGSSKLLVYRSEYAGTNRATAATWLIGNEIDRVVDELRKKGVSFEHYNLPGLTLKGDIHEADTMKAAWFKDPDGNIHALVTG
jgi:catechol 2,3-dioxygenase-like lactoylglutathione lyase family enzyme